MKFTKEEYETTINYDGLTGQWTFYTSVPSHIRILSKKATDLSREIKVLTEDEGKPTSIQFTVEKDSINPRNFIKSKRVPTDSQIEALKRRHTLS